MKTTSSNSKGKFGNIRKGVGYRSGFQDQSKVSQKYKNARYAIVNVSEKDLSKIIKEFKKIGILPYDKKRPKHEPTHSYFHRARQLAKCMMRADKTNQHNHGGYTEMTPPSFNVNVTDEEESKEIIMHETLWENNSMDASESERNIVNETFSQNNSADVPENTITELKYKEHKETSVTQKVTSYFNIFDCGMNLLDQLDVTYQQAFMATSAENEYYKEMMKSLIKANNEGGKLCNEKIQQAFIDLEAELNL